MKLFRLFTLGACALLLALPGTAMAAKNPNKANKADKTERKALRKIANQNDANSNGTIDGAELEAVRKIFEADKTGPLKSLDLNNDGTLSDTELADLKPHVKGEKKAGKGAGKKKNAL